MNDDVVTITPWSHAQQLARDALAHQQAALRAEDDLRSAGGHGPLQIDQPHGHEGFPGPMLGRPPPAPAQAQDSLPSTTASGGRRRDGGRKRLATHRCAANAPPAPRIAPAPSLNLSSTLLQDGGRVADLPDRDQDAVGVPGRRPLRTHPGRRARSLTDGLSRPSVIVTTPSRVGAVTCAAAHGAPLASRRPAPSLAVAFGSGRRRPEAPGPAASVTRRHAETETRHSWSDAYGSWKLGGGKVS